MGRAARARSRHGTREFDPGRQDLAGIPQPEGPNGGTALLQPVSAGEGAREIGVYYKKKSVGGAVFSQRAVNLPLLLDGKRREGWSFVPGCIVPVSDPVGGQIRCAITSRTPRAYRIRPTRIPDTVKPWVTSGTHCNRNPIRPVPNHECAAAIAGPSPGLS